MSVNFTDLMIPFDNTTEVLLIPTNDSVSPSISTIAPSSTPPSPTFNWYSPLESILLLLNFTTQFQSPKITNASVGKLPSLGTFVFPSSSKRPFYIENAYTNIASSFSTTTTTASHTTTFYPIKENDYSTHHVLNSSEEAFKEMEEVAKVFGDSRNIDRSNAIANFSNIWSADINETVSENGFNTTETFYWGDNNSTTFGVVLFENLTLNLSSEDSMLLLFDVEAAVTIATAVVLAFLILLTVVGNVFVIAAILLERNLQSVANYLILSLAVTDLLVACLVMPLGAVYEVSTAWTFGPELCDMWTVSDVLCCTASILHLVAIAMDRYWAVTNVDYIQQRSPRRVCSMIAVIWVVSALISAAPLMGWKDESWHERLLEDKVCMVSQDLYYQLFATMTSFYLPLGVILILYYRIYQAARSRIRRKGGPLRPQSAICTSTAAVSETTTFTRISSTNSPEKSSNGAVTDNEGEKNEEALRYKMAALPLNPLALLGARAPRRRELDARRERKAAKTLAVITGVFVMCWLPFFVLAITMPLCPNCNFNRYLLTTLLWLGYFNSTLNPIIYTIFSPDFRNAFTRILCGKQRVRRRHREARSSLRTAAAVTRTT